MKVDYVIVGDGFAGMFFAHRLYSAGKSFRIFSSGREGASKISAGVVNPVILKRFTTFSQAEEQIECLQETCAEIEKYTGKNYLINAPVCRIFHDEREKEIWIKKSDNEGLSKFLSKEFSSFYDVINPFGYGEVLQSCRLNVSEFFSSLMSHFSDKGFVINEDFDYQQLKGNSYKNLDFDKIVFCEGTGVSVNPFFKKLPVQPNKGHRLSVKLEKSLATDSTIKKKYFLFPENSDGYFLGATYDRFAENLGIEDEQVEHLKKSLAEIYPHNFKVSNVKTGFRATVPDRKPILGKSNVDDNYFIFNGLGARGVLNGCFYSKVLFDFIENNLPLPAEVDVRRFGD